MTIDNSVVNVAHIIREFLIASKTGDLLGTLNGEVSATASTLTLNDGYSLLLNAGVWPIKVGSELIVVTQSLGVLTEGVKGRAAFGSTAAIHADTTQVRRATLSDLIGTRVYESDLPTSFKNTAPGIAYDITSGSPQRDGPLRRAMASFKIYGGKDSANHIRDMFARMVYQAFAERIKEVPSAVSVDSGVLISAIEETEGQLLFDDSLEPEWPYIATICQFEAR